MISITYLSRAYKKFDSHELKTMLQGFQEHNEGIRVSGILLYNGAGTFIQILEGDEGCVDPLYAKIKNDPRHTNIICLRRAPIEHRSFSGWRMGFRKLSSETLMQQTAISDFLNDDKLENFVAKDTDFAIKVLTNFKNKMKEMIL